MFLKEWQQLSPAFAFDQRYQNLGLKRALKKEPEIGKSLPPATELCSIFLQRVCLLGLSPVPPTPIPLGVLSNFCRSLSGSFLLIPSD